MITGGVDLDGTGHGQDLTGFGGRNTVAVCILMLTLLPQEGLPSDALSWPSLPEG